MGGERSGQDTGPFPFKEPAVTMQDDCVWVSATRFVYWAGTAPEGRDRICAEQPESSSNRAADRAGLGWGGPADGAGARRGRDGLAQKERQRPGLRMLSQWYPGQPAACDAAKKFFSGNESCCRRALSHSEGLRSGGLGDPYWRGGVPIFFPLGKMLSPTFAQASHSPLSRELEKRP